MRKCRELEHCLNIDGGESKWSGDKETEGINEGELKQRDEIILELLGRGETRGNCDNVGIASIEGMCHP